MSLPVAGLRLPLHHVFHPSDFSQASEVAFAHALKLALAARAEFRIMHVAPKASDVPWTDFPGVRALLARWGLLPEGSSREDVAKLGINVEKILGFHSDPVASMLHALETHPTDQRRRFGHCRRTLHRCADQRLCGRGKRAGL